MGSSREAAVGELSGKVAVVTGASRGIGAAIAERFAGAGAAVAVTARTRQEGDHPFAGSLATVVTGISENGGRAIPIVADLAVQADRKRIIETATKELGPVDILVNNAAITYFEPVIDFDEKHFRLMFEVQVRAPFELAQLVLEGMRERKSGWIINISSGAGRHPQGPPYPGRGRGGGTVYGMCKAALERFTTGLASEVYADGIAVNVVSPSGLVLTPGVLHHRLDQFTPPERHEPVEVMAEAAYVLATGDPATLTGKVTYAKQILDEVGKSADSA
jgi:NAD(P)-dependent dehydrogenase (short-subunit alcohol dehydrogenase family)